MNINDFRSFEFDLYYGLNKEDQQDNDLDKNGLAPAEPVDYGMDVVIAPPQNFPGIQVTGTGSGSVCSCRSVCYSCSVCSEC